MVPFNSISHNILLQRLSCIFKDRPLLRLFERIVSSFRVHEGRGLPIGSLTSQHFANFYLGWFDRFVKEQLRVKGYVRYMDDMIIWGENPQSLQSLLRRCREFLLDDLELTLKPHAYINHTVHGVDFLGCRVLPDHLILNRRSRLRFRRRMTHLETQFMDGEIGESELQQRATSLVAFTQSAGAKSWHFRRRVLQQLPVSGHGPRTG